MQILRTIVLVRLFPVVLSSLAVQLAVNQYETAGLKWRGRRGHLLSPSQYDHGAVLCRHPRSIRSCRRLLGRRCRWWILWDEVCGLSPMSNTEARDATPPWDSTMDQHSRRRCGVVSPSPVRRLACHPGTNRMQCHPLNGILSSRGVLSPKCRNPWKSPPRAGACNRSYHALSWQIVA